MPVGRLWSVTLDCDDPKPLAQFWIDMVGGGIGFESDDFVFAELSTGFGIGAYRVPDHVAPAWPDGDVAKQFHLDVAVPDLDEAEAAALRLGATKAEHQPRPDKWRVLLDPAGHPFCITDQA